MNREVLANARLRYFEGGRDENKIELYRESATQDNLVFAKIKFKRETYILKFKCGSVVEGVCFLTKNPFFEVGEEIGIEGGVLGSGAIERCVKQIIDLMHSPTEHDYFDCEYD